LKNNGADSYKELMELKNKYNNIIHDDNVVNKINEHKNYLQDTNEINNDNKISENFKEDDDILDSDFKKFKRNINLLEKTIKNDTVKALTIENYDDDIMK
jgi:hypothetical protein